MLVLSLVLAVVALYLSDYAQLDACEPATLYIWLVVWQCQSVVGQLTLDVNSAQGAVSYIRPTWAKRYTYPSSSEKPGTGATLSRGTFEGTRKCSRLVRAPL